MWASVQNCNLRKPVNALHQKITKVDESLLQEMEKNEVLEKEEELAEEIR